MPLAPPQIPTKPCLNSISIVITFRSLTPPPPPAYLWAVLDVVAFAEAQVTKVPLRGSLGSLFDRALEEAGKIGQVVVIWRVERPARLRLFDVRAFQQLELIVQIGRERVERVGHTLYEQGRRTYNKSVRQAREETQTFN